jgi:hypothetical protein
MDPPANPFASREQDTVTILRNLIKQATLEEEVSEASETHSVPNKIRILESVSDEMRKSQENGSDQKQLSEEDEIDILDSKAMSFSFSCHGGGPKRKKCNDKKRKQQEEKSKKKLKVLVETLKLVPFKPLKTLDFACYESLLKTLGLWDFVHLEFDQDMDYDLVAQLIASYSAGGKCSYINGSRIKLSRADLARSLKLPNKKERVVILDEDKEFLESDESISVVEDVISNWMLLHCDDAWMMPDEVVEWMKGIKKKQLDKLDWAGLMWFMVEKELKAEPPLGDCFYASHLQMVIRSQKIDLFKERDLKVKDDIAALNLGMDDGATDSKKENCVEESTTKLNLGQVIVSEMAATMELYHEEQAIDLEENKEQPMDLKEAKEEGDEMEWRQPCWLTFFSGV